jgi:hypothetical protein
MVITAVTKFTFIRETESVRTSMDDGDGGEASFRCCCAMLFQVLG